MNTVHILPMTHSNIPHLRLDVPNALFLSRFPTKILFHSPHIPKKLRNPTRELSHEGNGHVLQNLTKSPLYNEISLYSVFLISSFFSEFPSATALPSSHFTITYTSSTGRQYKMELGSALVNRKTP